MYNGSKTEEITLTNKSKYPNLYEYESIPENNNYFIFPIQSSNPYSLIESEDISQIYSNLVEEICLFNIYKEINYDIALQKEFSTSMFTFEASIDQKEFYNNLIYLLQGIPSSTFSLGEKFPFTFELNKNSNTNNLRLIGTLPGMTKNILEKFINFGTKMHLMQFMVKKYLFDVEYRINNTMPQFFENFFRGINEIFIKTNEKIIFYKKLITQENFTMLTLYNKVKSLSQIINVIYIIFNLNEEKYLTQFKGNTLEEFFMYYNEHNSFKKINVFLDMLLKVYYTFYSKDKIFLIIKHILLSSLHSYLYYIINLIFTGESNDDNDSHFILSSNNGSNDNISLDTKKLPKFLFEHRHLLLNNTILTKYIKKFDENYYNMLTYNLKDFIEYINNINIRKFSVDSLNNFKMFKEEIYKKKIKLMEIINKEVISLQELKENEINLKNIQKIKEIKDYFTEYEKEQMNKKIKLKEKKEKYFNELNEQILGRKRKIEEEIQNLKKEKIAQKEKEQKEKENEIKFIHLMKLKYRQIQERTKDIEIFGSLVNKWIYQRNELNEKRKILFEKLYGDNASNFLEENYPENGIGNNEKKNYHKTVEEQLEMIKDEINKKIVDDEENKKQRTLYNNSDNIKQIFNQIEEKKEENKESNNDNDMILKNNEIQKINDNNKDDIIMNNNDSKELNENDKKPKENLNEKENEENKKEDESNTKNDNEIKEKEKDKKKEEDKKKIKEEDNEKEKEKEKDNEKYNEKDNENKNEKTIAQLNNNNKNKYLQSINLFPEKGIPEEIDTLYQLSALIESESESNENNFINELYPERKLKNKKQIPIQLILKEFFYDIISKQNTITNQTFVLMLKNKFGLMHHFDFFNSIILCKKGNLILQYIESIFDFKTLTLNTSDPEFLTNELRSLIKADYENNIKSLYLNDLLESLKFKRISELNLNYTVNNLELNFKLEYTAIAPIDIIFNNSNSDVYDKIFKKLLKYNIYEQICVRIYQILKNMRMLNLNKTKIYSNFNEDNSNSIEDEDLIKENNNSIFTERLIKLFNNSFKIFKGILSYIYQQIIEKTWNEMEQKIETSIEVFQVIKYHNEAIKYIKTFFDKCPLILYFENLCNDLSQLYLQIVFSDYYDKQQEKNEYLKEILNKIKEDNKAIINFRNSLGEINPFFSLSFYL